MSRWRSFFFIDLLVIMAFTTHVTMPRHEQKVVALNSLRRRPPPPAPAPRTPDPVRALSLLASSLEASDLAGKTAPRNAELNAFREQLRAVDAREMAEFSAISQQLRQLGLP